MKGEPILVMLVEDNADHAELVIRTLEDHRIANKVIHFWMDKPLWTTCSVVMDMKIPKSLPART